MRQLAGLGRPLRLLLDQGVDEVAERGHLLGDAVVHLAGEPAALLDGRRVAERQEQHGGVEADGRRAELAVEGRESARQVHGVGVEAGRQDAGDDRGDAAAAVEREGEAVADHAHVAGHQAVLRELLAHRQVGVADAGVTDQGREDLAARDVDGQGGHGQLVAHGALDLAAQGDRVEAGAQAAGQADQLADQGLRVAVGALRVGGVQEVASGRTTRSGRGRAR